MTRELVPRESRGQRQNSKDSGRTRAKRPVPTEAGKSLKTSIYQKHARKAEKLLRSLKMKEDKVKPETTKQNVCLMT